ncbi:hypothetical protein ACSLOX_25765, partial [Escherichia coli]
KNGRIDGVFGDTAVVNEWLKTNPQLGVATEKVTDPQYFGTGLRHKRLWTLLQMGNGRHQRLSMKVFVMQLDSIRKM